MRKAGECHHTWRVSQCSTSSTLKNGIRLPTKLKADLYSLRHSHEGACRHSSIQLFNGNFINTTFFPCNLLQQTIICFSSTRYHMDFPHGRHHEPHHGRHGREQEQEEFPPPPLYGDEPPPPYYGLNQPPPRYDQSSEVHHTSHVGGPDSYRPPPPAASHGYDPPPYGAADDRHQHRPHMPHFPSSDHHQTHHHEGGGISGKASVKVYSKAETNFSLTIRDGKVILAPSDPSDPCQHWIKEEKYSTKVKDEEGFPSFALINKATGQAMKHATGATHPVQLTPYNPNTVDESILWTESKDLGDGYRTIRMVNNIKLNVDAFNGDENHGGVHDGTKIVLWEWKKGGNQRWKIAPY